MKIYVAGHSGMVGSSIVSQLEKLSFYGKKLKLNLILYTIIIFAIYVFLLLQT